MVAKYKDYTVKELKKALQNLKSNKGDLSEIKYVSRTLRDKLRNNNKDGLTSDSNVTMSHSITTITAICVQAQTANIFARLFTFETGRLPLETEMFHRSCDLSH